MYQIINLAHEKKGRVSGNLTETRDFYPWVSIHELILELNPRQIYALSTLLKKMIEVQDQRHDIEYKQR